MEWSIQRGDTGADGRERVDVGGAHGANSAGRAVLLVVGMEDQQDLQGALQYLVRLVPPADAERHVHEVADVVQIVARELVRESAGVAEGKCRDRRQLGQQAHPLQVAVRRIVNVFRVGIERGERTYGAEQHAHRMGVVAEALEELGDVGVYVCVELDLLFPLAQLLLARQLALAEQIGHLEKRGLLRQLLDWVTTVSQDALVTVDERDRAATGRGVHEGRIVGHHPEVIVGDLDLPQVGSLDGAFGDRQLVALAGSVIGDGNAVLGQAVLGGMGLQRSRLQCGT